MRVWILSIGLVLVTASTAFAASPEFDRLKQLEGRWKGKSVSKHSDAGMSEEVEVDYHASAGGAVLVETLMPGSDHEMVTTYYEENGKPAMTHYCLMGNRPQLSLAGSDEKKLEFSLRDGSLDASTPHMHALTLNWTDADHVTQEWTSFADGKPNGTTTLQLSRVQ